MKKEHITQVSEEDLAKLRPKSKTDWQRIDALSDEEISRAIADDPDAAPALDEEWFRTAEIVSPRTKQPVYIRLDADVLDWFKAQGPGYQTRIGAVLRAYVNAHRER